MFGSWGQRRRNTPSRANDALVMYQRASPLAQDRAVVLYDGPNLRERMHDYMDAVQDASPEVVPEGAPSAVTDESPESGDDEPEALEIPYFGESWWAQAKRSVKRLVMKCCCQGDEVQYWDREVAMDKAVRREMMKTLAPKPNMTLQERVVADVERVNAKTVKHVPRLVAEVVVALRCKLGMGAQDSRVPGNVALVRAEAAKMMRDWNVRAKDAAAHLVEVERCFFEDDCHYRVSTWRARGVRNSRFFKWFIGSREPVGFDY